MKNIELPIINSELKIKFLIGKNALDNFSIIDNSNKEDIWFHLEDYPSSHVIAKVFNITINKKELKYIIKQGALLCKQNSKYASYPNIKIIYTKINNVKKTNVIGSVITMNTQRIII